MQQAAYCSLRLALQILQRGLPERLLREITVVHGGYRVRKELTEDNLRRLKLSSLKSCSVRSLRWMAMMTTDMLNIDTTRKHGKDKLKAWIKHRVGVRGDKVFWGKLMTGAGGLGGQQGGGHGGDRGPPEQGNMKEDRPDVSEERGGERLVLSETQEGLESEGVLPCQRRQAGCTRGGERKNTQKGDSNRMWRLHWRGKQKGKKRTSVAKQDWEGGGLERLEGWLPMFLNERMQACSRPPGVGGHVSKGGGEDRPCWRHAARSGVG